MKVNLTYFSEHGKFKYSGEYETEKEYLFEIWDEIENMDIHPGIICRWTRGGILVSVPDHPHNHLRIIYVVE